LALGSSLLSFAKKRYCVFKEQVGTKGAYNSPTITFSAKIIAQASGIIKQKTICSGAVAGCDGSSVSFDDLGTATWSGSLVSGDSPPNQDQFVAIKRTDLNRWQIARRSTFDSYLPLPSTMDSQLTEFKTIFAKTTEPLVGDNYINNLLAQINPQADALLLEDTSFTSSPFTKDDATGKVSVTLNRKLTSPNIVFRIRADWIGLVIPSGKPKILSASSEKFASGEGGTITVQIENQGEADGTFSVMLEDCEPFIQSTTSATSRETIAVGDIKTINIGVSGGNIAEKLSKTCKVKVYDINDPSSYDYASVTIDLESSKVCVPGKISAEGQLIKKCNADGTAFEIVKNCPDVIILDKQGNYDCAPNQKTTNGVLNSNIGGLIGTAGNAVPYTVDLQHLDLKTVSGLAHNIKSVRNDYCHYESSVPIVNVSLRDAIEIVPGLDSISTKVCARWLDDIFNVGTAALDIATSFQELTK